MGRRSKAKSKAQNEEEFAALIAEIDPNPAVLDLPHQPTKFQKVWWNRYIGEPFRAALTTRGNKNDNGVSWVRTKFIKEFCPELYPGLTLEECEQYYRLLGQVFFIFYFFCDFMFHLLTPLILQKFYNYLTNHTNNNTHGVKVKEPRVKSRAYGYDIWRQENPEQFAQMKAEYVESHPECNEDNVGNRRSLYAKLFKLLPASDQADYKARAQDKLKAEQAMDLLVGKDRNL